MTRLPDAIFVIDSNEEADRGAEARKLGIPVVAVVDTNCDPGRVDYVIPGNDDALRAIRLFASKISDSVARRRTTDVRASRSPTDSASCTNRQPSGAASKNVRAAAPLKCEPMTKSRKTISLGAACAAAQRPAKEAVEDDVPQAETPNVLNLFVAGKFSVSHKR